MRSTEFGNRFAERYWWHKISDTNYVPPVYSFLTDSEWKTIENWFEDTDKTWGPNTGECTVPAISILQGLIMGSGITRIAQFGHYIGYSTILMGYMLRRMGAHHGLFSIDIDPVATEYTASWVAKAELGHYVNLVVSDSANADLPERAKEYLGGSPELIFIDSSHQYEHTWRELDLWYPHLPEGGLILLHDVSRLAATFDSTGKGGVFRALTEWCTSHGLSFFALNPFVTGGTAMDLAYADRCGLGIIQKCPTHTTM